MKKSIMLLCSLLSVSAFACPQLAGEYYNCTSGDAISDDFLDVPETLTITQKVVDGKMTYTYVTVNSYGEEKTVVKVPGGPARNWSEDLDEFPGQVNFTSSSQCVGNSVNSTVSGEIVMDDIFSEEERRAFEDMLGGFLSLKSEASVEGSEYVEKVAFAQNPSEVFEFRCSRK